MNIRKKASIIGGIWGLVGFWLVPKNYAGGTTLEDWIQKIPDVIQILLSFPSYVLFKIGLMDYFLGNCNDSCFQMLVFIPLFILISIALGALIGYGIAKIYLKVKQDKSQLKKNT